MINTKKTFQVYVWWFFLKQTLLKNFLIQIWNFTLYNSNNISVQVFEF